MCRREVEQGFKNSLNWGKKAEKYKANCYRNVKLIVASELDEGSNLALVTCGYSRCASFDEIVQKSHLNFNQVLRWQTRSN